MPSLTQYCACVFKTPPQALNNHLSEGRKRLLLAEANRNSAPSASIDKCAAVWQHGHKDMIENWVFNVAATAALSVKIGNHKSVFSKMQHRFARAAISKLILGASSKSFLLADGKCLLCWPERSKLRERENMCFLNIPQTIGTNA